jgi:hypothetical protein
MNIFDVGVLLPDISRVALESAVDEAACEFDLWLTL